MAIKIGGTTVINDSKIFDVTGCQGKYDQTHPWGTIASSTVSGSQSLDFTGSPNTVFRDYAQNGGLSGNVTWTFNSANVAAGRQMTLFVDASTSGYDQDFALSGGTILYPEDSEPDWTTARFWMHRITCWDSSTISVVSTSWGTASSGGGASQVDLPTSIDLYASSGTLGGDCNAVVRLNSSGTLTLTGSGTQGSVSGTADSGFTWLLSGSAGDYESNFNYTFTNNGGADQSTAGNNTCELLSTNREWKIFDASTSNTENKLAGTLKIRRTSDNTELVSIACELSAAHTP